MNKVKLLYDIVKTMKEKDVFEGQLDVAVNKGSEAIFKMNNEFYKNLSGGESKIKLNTEVLHDGKKVRHQSETEFTGDCCEKHQAFFKHIHQLHHEKCAIGEFGKQCGIKWKLNKLACILGILHNLKVSESEKGCQISLDKNDIPEDMKICLHEKLSQKMMEKHNQCCSQLEGMELTDINLVITISKSNDIENIHLSVKGKCSCSESGEQNVDISVNISFIW